MAAASGSKKQLIVTYREYFPLLIRYKNSNPLENIKIIDKDELLEKISYKLKDDPIPYLIKQGIDYSNAKKYLHIFLVGDIPEKNKNLYSVFESVETLFFKKDEYGLEELNGYFIKDGEGNWVKGIQFFAMDEDIEVKNLCERNKIKYKFINPESLGIDNQTKLIKGEHPPIIYYQNKYEQFFSIFSKIRQRLLEHPEDKDKIQILAEDADAYYIKIFSELFDIDTMLVSRKNLLTYASTRKKIKEIFQKKDFSISEEELSKDEHLKELDEEIKKYGLRELKDFSYAYANLLEIVNAKTHKELSSDRGILVSKDLSIGSDRYIYVTNFKHDVFYNVQSDKDILPDNDLKALGVNPSYAKTLLDRRFKSDFIKYNHIEMLSLAKQHLSEKVFDSQFIEELGLKDGIVTYEDEIEGVITSKANRLHVADQYDKVFFYGKAKIDDESDFRGYDNSFKGIKESITKNKKSWAITNLERYITCPFKYYISDLLPNRNDDFHSRWRGTLIHKLLEKINDPKYDFDKEWTESENLYKEIVKKDGFEFDKKEEILLGILHFHLKNAMDVYHSHNEAMNLEYAAYEVKVPFALEDEEGNIYQFNSRIDKVIRTKNENGKSYYTIIDYKTGNEKFIITNTFLGSSIQLPMYYFALNQQTDEESDAFKLTNDAIFGGFGIKKVYASSPKSLYCKDDFVSTEGLKYNTKIVGEALYSVDYSNSFDETTKITKDGKINTQIGGTYISFYNKFISDDPESEDVLIRDSSLSRYNMQDLVNDSKKSMIETIKKIENVEFPIAPTSTGSLKSLNSRNLACTYCNYKDVCYRSSKDIKDYSLDVIRHYLLKK